MALTRDALRVRHSTNVCIMSYGFGELRRYAKLSVVADAASGPASIRCDNLTTTLRRDFPSFSHDITLPAADRVL